MSGIIFPPCTPITGFPGQQLTKYRRPTQNTHAQRALSGKESRISLRAYPLMEWELSFDWLPDNTLPNGAGRYNYVKWSQDFTQWSSSQGGAGFAPVIIGNWLGSLAPDGTYTADRVILNQAASSGGNFSQIFTNLTGPSPAFIGPAPYNAPYTFSVWLKTNDGSTKNMGLLYWDGTVQTRKNIVVTGAWQRFSSSALNPYAVPGRFQQVYIALNGAIDSAYADISAWGAQVEAGMQVTRYIPTNGVALRQSDFATMLGVFTGMLGQWDTFLYQDPDFNTVQLSQFATGNASTTAFNLTTTFQPITDAAQYGYGATAVGGLAGQPEWIQNCNGLPSIFTARYGGPELLRTSSRTNLTIQSEFAPGAAPTNGSLTQTAGGALGATTYFVKVTATSSSGSEETLPSAETSLAVSANNVLNVAAPSGLPAGATGWNVYVSNTAGGGSGAETKQNATPIATGTAWVEPTSGLIAGSSLPLINTYPLNWGIGAAGTNAVATPNAAVAPNGTTTALSFTEGTSNNIFSLQGAQNAVLTANTRYTHSVFLKYGSCQYVGVNLDDGSANGMVALFDLLNGLVVGIFTQGTAYFSLADVSMTPFGNTGWYRCAVSGQFAGTTARLSIVHFNNSTPAWYPTFAGTGRITFIWGDQLELGTVPTAYIPVTTAHVTAPADYSLTFLTTAGTAVQTFQQVSFAAAPANNVPLLWTGSFFYRVRFSEDIMEPVEILFGHWKLDSLKLEQVPL